MPNKLIEKIGSIEGSIFGVLETPCSPRTYYGGRIENIKGEWFTTDNATCNFFRKDTDAYVHAMTKYEQYKKTVAEDQEKHNAKILHTRA